MADEKALGLSVLSTIRDWVKSLIPGTATTSTKGIVQPDGTTITINNGVISAAGGSSVTVDSVLSSTSENPVQNKVINSALSGKVDKTATDDTATSSILNEGYTAKLEVSDSSSDYESFSRVFSDSVTNQVASANGREMAYVEVKENGVFLSVQNSNSSPSQYNAISMSSTQTHIHNVPTPTDSGDAVPKSYVDNGLSEKQATLVSGTNIKTVNGNSLLGSGDIAVSGLPSVTASDNGKFLRVVNGAWAADTVPSANGVNF